MLSRMKKSKKQYKKPVTTQFYYSNYFISITTSLSVLKMMLRILYTMLMQNLLPAAERYHSTDVCT